MKKKVKALGRTKRDAGIQEVLPWDKKKHPSLFDQKRELATNSLLMDKQLEEISPKMPSDDRFAATISKLQHDNLQLKAVISTYLAKFKEAADMWNDELKAKNKRIAELEAELERLKEQTTR